MMDDFWSTFCGESDCPGNGGKPPFCYDFKILKDPSSCTDQFLIICFDVLLLIMLAFILMQKSFFKPFRGIWVIEEEVKEEHTFVFPLKLVVGRALSRIQMVVNKLFLCALSMYYTVTPFAKAGFFSKITFWWLSPLIKKGQKKTLLDEDVPKLSESDRAERCYSSFVDHLSRQKKKEPLSEKSYLWAIILCHQREILISGLFALLKVLTLSASPLLLNAFILVYEGNGSFKYEGYALAISFLFIKIIESISQRQWYFRSRLVGMKLRSQLTAAICQKQLRLSNAARLIHSGGEVMNYVTVDAYKIGEFPFWFHQTWTIIVQLCTVLVILYNAVGLATIAALVVIVLTVLCNTPIAKLQHKFLTELLVAEDERLKACSEALVNMKVLKLYAWEIHFKNSIESLRNVELKWLSSVLFQKAYNIILFWFSPILVYVATFVACYFLKIPLHANNLFTFVATLRLVQDPISIIPDVIGVVIQAKVAFSRIVKFLEAPELQRESVRKRCCNEKLKGSTLIKSADFSWECNVSKPTLRNINLEVRPGQKIAICGEVGSGKSTLLAAILGEVPNTKGNIAVYGKLAYVSQTAWIPTGTIQENILFGSALDVQRYQETLHRSSLVKDLELFPHGELTEIGERGVNLSGGQKQRVQLARALYQNADVYLLDDPFSAVDAQTATNLFNEYILEGLAGKTVLLVTHQVDFLPAFDSILFISEGTILQAAPYHQLLVSSKEFRELVNAHRETAGSGQLANGTSTQRHSNSGREISQIFVEKQFKPSKDDQLIKQEERERGDIGLKPYLQYLNQNKGYIYTFVASLSHLLFVICQILQNSWMAANVDNPQVNTLQLIVVYLLIGVSSTVFVVSRSLLAVALGLQSSKYLFSQLVNSLFRAPMSFYDSTPLGRILSRVSLDLSIADLDIPFVLTYTVGSTINCYADLVVLAIITWQVLFVAVAMVYFVIRLQRHYLVAAKEYMRMNGTTKSFVANHVAETVAGAITIRAFEEEDQRLNQYMHIPSEAEEVIKGKRPPLNWPDAGKVEIYDLQIRYRPQEPLVLDGITCTFEGGHKIGIVGRTGSGKSTLISALFRLVEPAGGKIIVDGINISSIGLHDLSFHVKVLGKCQLQEAVQDKEGGLDSSVVEDGSNWSIGQRQLFCLGRALLRRSKILVLDEATASIDNATDLILQKSIRTEFGNCTVITVAHRIPTVMDCTMVLAISDGKLVEYDETMNLMKNEKSLFGQLVKEYWSHFQCAESH
ncbi:unnamed protein product [Sphenostylis stenocarpa]|uniref:ABC-type xenobiotic transporter n=1 Tax=Sphenostylis stenocarpa TaxID=92480 RepID=A0AA86SDH4_9FABA|nr:unnamed protein product [Sphenostylis stenocarpa]